MNNFGTGEATATDEPLRLRSIANVALLIDFAKARGLHADAMLQGTGIRQEQLQDPNQEITLAQDIELTRNVVAAVHDEPGLGLMAGLLCHAPNFGVLGFAAMSSRTLRQAADIGLGYTDLSFAIATLRLEEHGDETWVVRADEAVPADLRQFTLERDFAAMATIQQDILQTRVPVVRVELTLQAHPIYEMFATLLGVDHLMFGMSRSLIVYRSSSLDAPLPQANPALARYYEQQCQEVMERRRSLTGISGQVRRLLIRHGRASDQSRIAADLGVGVRTLRRRLAGEGTTFRELSNETVGILAEELLMTGLTVEQVAERLGYSSVSAFTTAFRSWKGQSPGTFARANRGRVSARA